MVTKTVDDGSENTLRWAIAKAHADDVSNSELIRFAIGSGTQTITLQSELDPIDHNNTTVDGTSQPGYTGIPLIQLRSGNPLADEAINVAGSNGYLIEGLDIRGFKQNFGTGIFTDGSNGMITRNVIIGNRIGVRCQSRGISGEAARDNNVIGGTNPDDGNVISGNLDAGVVLIGAQGDKVQGNLIGTTVDGLSALPNGVGVLIEEDSENNLIGGTDPSAVNVISGNTAAGVYITDLPDTTGPVSSFNQVQGNVIGIGLDGTALGNDKGVVIDNGTHGNTIGGTDPGAGNIISGNVGYGVEIDSTGRNDVVANFIGPDALGSAGSGNLIGVVIDGGDGDQNITDNVISANRSGGVQIGGGSSGTVVAGNRIGTDPSGMVALGNGEAFLDGGGTGDGVFIAFASDNTVVGNLISGQTENGVVITGAGTTGNRLQGNRIGTDITGAPKLPNLHGVVIEQGAGDNQVGDASPGDGNLIAGNKNAGVLITGAGTTNNKVRANEIFNNSDGVDIEDGATSNEIGGADPLDGNVIEANVTFSDLSHDPTAGIRIDGANANHVMQNRIDENEEGVVIENGANSNVIGGDQSAAEGNMITQNHGDGVAISGSGTHQNLLVNNLIGANFGDGVLIAAGASSNTVGEKGSGNMIGGSGAAGVMVQGHGTTLNLIAGNQIESNEIGVDIEDGASTNGVGTVVPEPVGNVIRANRSFGVRISGSGTSFNEVEACDIGSMTSDPELANGTGVRVDGGATSNFIGEVDPGSGNHIFGNMEDGVDIRDSGTSHNAILSNLIGGTVVVDGAPATGDGVRIGPGASNNIVGVPADLVGGRDVGNVITQNSGRGVNVVGDDATGNSIRANSIFDNTVLGIDLGNNGVTQNTSGGPHTGPNNLQNFPTLLSVTVDMATNTGSVSFMLDSGADNQYVVDFYANTAADPSNHGQGRTYLGHMLVPAVNVPATFTFTPVPGQPYISATATDLAGNTSEFSGAAAPSPLQILNGRLLVRLDDSQPFRVQRDPFFPRLLDLAFGGDKPFVVSVDPSAFTGVEVDGGANDAIAIDAVPAGVSLAVNASTGSVVSVSPSARDLGTIQGSLQVTAGEGTALDLNDSGAAAGRTYDLTSNTLTWGGPGAVTFSLPGPVTLTGTPFNDAVDVRSVPGNPVTIHGGGGANDKLVGPDADNTWLLARPAGAEGTLDGSVVFDSFASLVGGQGRDRFVVPDGATVPEFLSGGDGATGGANNTLDLSSWTGPLTEHITTTVYGGNVTTPSGGVETVVVRAFALCQNVLGGQGDDRFVFDQGFGLTTADGGGGSNTLDFSPYFRSPSFLSPPAWVFEILGHNSGLVPGVITSYRNIQSLVGTKVDDRYAFRGTAYLDGTIDGQGGTNSLEYQQATVPVTVNLQTSSASGVNYRGGSAPQQGGISNIQNFVGSQSAPSTLIGPDTNDTWTIDGPNSGHLAGFGFTNFSNLVGGAAADTFAFRQGGSVSGAVDGAGATNALDYSQYTGDIVVDLPLGLASLIRQGAAGGVFHVANVTGGVGNALLVGDANANLLTGGTGRNVLIGGAGSDTLDASRSLDDNLLIGGRTDWDGNVAALDAIFAEWTRTDLGFSDRRSDLLNGTNSQAKTPLNQAGGQLVLLTPATNPRSTNGTVHADGAADTLIGADLASPLTGRRAHNWFLYDAPDVLVNVDSGSDRKNKVT
jgi:hypothetical protein